MALDVHGVAGLAVGLAAEEVVEPDVVERRRGRECRQVAADAVGVLVGLHDHDGRVPSDVRADAPLELFVAREPGFLFRRDRVDVGGGHRGGVADLQLACTLEQLGHEVAGAGLAVGVDDGVERLQPLLGLGRVGVGKLVHEPVDDHGPMLAPIGGRSNVLRVTRTFQRTRRGRGRCPRRVVPGQSVPSAARRPAVMPVTSSRSVPTLAASAGSGGPASVMPSNSPFVQCT